MANKQTLHEVERGEILRYLAEVYPRAATPRTLQHHLDYVGYAVTADDLDFHLGYLAQKGFLEVETYPTDVGEEREIRVLRITPAGIDLLDRRRKGEPGVRF